MRRRKNTANVGWFDEHDLPDSPFLRLKQRLEDPDG